jgi:hypothetical protein
MRVFQNSAIYTGYLPRLRTLARGRSSFADLRDAFLADRFGAPHFLKPVLDGATSSFFTNGDDPVLQRTWASENGLVASAGLDEILLAQIEHHRTEVFYNLDPVRYDSAFLKRLPGSVRRTIGWRAAPLGGADLSGYDLIVSNFPGILAQWEAAGVRTAPFFPAHDPVLDSYAAAGERSVDVVFFGGYSRHHQRRSRILREVASLSDRYRVQFHLDRSRLTRLAETPLGRLPGLAAYARPAEIRRVSRPAVFGRELYEALGNARIVINCAIDMAGNERGNMRCFETMGAGALLVSDEGIYPAGMTAGVTLVSYAGPGDAADRVRHALENWEAHREIAAAGAAMVRDRYSKERQWRCFEQLAA